MQRWQRAAHKWNPLNGKPTFRGCGYAFRDSSPTLRPITNAGAMLLTFGRTH